MKALELIKQHQGKPIYEFNSNGAVSFELNNGQFIILPEQGDSSLLFESVTEYKKFLKSPKFPEPAKNMNAEIFLMKMKNFEQLNEANFGEE